VKKKKKTAQKLHSSVEAQLTKLEEKSNSKTYVHQWSLTDSSADPWFKKKKKRKEEKFFRGKWEGEENVGVMRNSFSNLFCRKTVKTPVMRRADDR
jgi:predicted secreted protein